MIHLDDNALPVASYSIWRYTLFRVLSESLIEEGYSGSLDSRQKVVRAEQMVVAAAWIKYGSGVEPADRH